VHEIGGKMQRVQLNAEGLEGYFTTTSPLEERERKLLATYLRQLLHFGASLKLAYRAGNIISYRIIALHTIPHIPISLNRKSLFETCVSMAAK